MNTIDAETKPVGKKVAAFMVNKPIWVFWAVYLAMSGVLFGVMIVVVRLVSRPWWIALITIIAVGIIWGTSRYFAMKSSQKTDEEE